MKAACSSGVLWDQISKSQSPRQRHLETVLQIVQASEVHKAEDFSLRHFPLV